MSRGMFASIAASDAYKNADKEWCVELQTYHKYWYDLVVNPNDVADYFDTRKLIVEYLRAVKKHVEESLEKRFIYFICSREKVRFDTNKKPSFNPITKKQKYTYGLVSIRKNDQYIVSFTTCTAKNFACRKSVLVKNI